MNAPSAYFVKGIRGTDPIAFDGTPQVAFVGRSNVGKSSLIAALTQNKKLVMVSNTPGKTQELNFFFVNESFYLIDLPGYGYAQVPPKQKEKLQKLILWYLAGSGVRPRRVVLVLDAKVGVTEFDRQMLEILREREHPFLVVANKIDKLNRREASAQLQVIRDAIGLDADILPTSAEKGDGVSILFDRLSV